MSETVKGFLFDLDGVFYVGDSLIPGALECLAELDARSVPYRFVTNTTTMSSAMLMHKLAAMGLQCRPGDLVSAPVATASYLKRNGLNSCFFAVDDAVQADFDGFRQCDDTPQAVIVGDIGDAWNYALVDRLFGFIIGGAELVAMHRNKYWQKQEGLHVDIGAFVAGLEYVAGVEAVITGKPSTVFFDAAIASLGVPRKQVVLVGDDIQSDIGGAQRAGIRAALVKTGKYRPELAAKSGIEPEWVLNSIADLAREIV
jgi:HAD superfamily hydrolase (TIGR01458 family)